MSTSSLTVCRGYGEKSLPICAIYRHRNGDVENHVKDLQEIIGPLSIVNGLPSGDTTNLANGPECLAAQLVMRLKQKAQNGGIYLHPIPPFYSSVGSPYIYEIWVDAPFGDVYLKIIHKKEVVFSGKLSVASSNYQHANAE